MVLLPNINIPPVLTADDIEKLKEELSKQPPKLFYFLHPHEVKKLKELNMFNPETMKEINSD